MHEHVKTAFPCQTVNLSWPISFFCQIQTWMLGVCGGEICRTGRSSICISKLNNNRMILSQTRLPSALIFNSTVLCNVHVDSCGRVEGLCAQIGSSPWNHWLTFPGAGVCAVIWVTRKLEGVSWPNSWVWLKQRNGLYSPSASLPAEFCVRVGKQLKVKAC